MFKKLLLSTAMAATMAVTAAPVSAAQISVVIAPPAPRSMVMPAARAGYIWVPGYWNWSNNRHVWREGIWMRERSGYYYTEPAWSQTNGRWNLNRGGWKRGDRDHDGVPNRFDKDKDGDGVRNRNDSNPNNPRKN